MPLLLAIAFNLINLGYFWFMVLTLAAAPRQGVHTWGMLFPIDVVVLDNDWTVLAIRRCMRQFRVTRIFWKAAAVLELPSGKLDSTSTSIGDKLVFDRV